MHQAQFDQFLSSTERAADVAEALMVMWDDYTPEEKERLLSALRMCCSSLEMVLSGGTKQ